MPDTHSDPNNHTAPTPPASSSAVRAWVAGTLSFVFPGLGQAFNRQWTKAFTLAGLALLLLAATYVRALTLTAWLVYLLLWMPAIADAFQTARAKSLGQWYYAKPYVIMMLLATGPIALPLLLKSPQFSKTERIAWTVFVVAIVVIFLLTIAAAQTLLSAYGIDLHHTDMDQVLQQLLSGL